MPSRPGAWWPSGWWEQQDGSLPVEEHPPACHLVPLRGVTLPSPPFLPSLVSLPSPPLTTLSHLSSSSHADVVWGSSCVWSLFCSPHLYGVFTFSAWRPSSPSRPPRFSSFRLPFASSRLLPPPSSRLRYWPVLGCFCCFLGMAFGRFSFLSLLGPLCALLDCRAPLLLCPRRVLTRNNSA